MRASKAVLTLGMASCGLIFGCAHAPVSPAVRTLAQEVTALAAPDYYAGVPRATGHMLLAALHTLVAKHKDLGYDHARDVMFGQIDDVTNSDEIVDIYSGRLFRGVTDSKSAFERGLNTEHSWCQSNGAAGVAKDDLHILFPVDGEANSVRNNHPYGEVSQVIQELPDFYGDGLHSVLGKGTGSEANVVVFEPRATHRGDLARAVLYFYTCYARFDGKPDPLDVSNFKLEQEVLYKWHQADPPSAWEKKRNDDIYKVQGNRNPFVDHPEWVGAIGKFLP